jgi:hypothetical protein
MAVADRVLTPVIAICGAGESAMAWLKVAVIVNEVPDFTAWFGE